MRVLWTRSAVGEMAVYLRAPGIVVRCPRCESVLTVVVETHGVMCLDLAGFAALDPAAEPFVLLAR